MDDEAQNLVGRYTHTHARTHARTHRSTRTQDNTDYRKFNFNQFKTEPGTENKAYLNRLWKRNVLRLQLNESREGFCRRGRGRSFHVDGPKTEKAWEPTAEGLVRAIWSLRISEAKRTVREGV